MSDDVCEAKQVLQTERILKRLHQNNENLAAIKVQLRELEERILGDQSKSPNGPEKERPAPRSVFLDQTHYVLDDTESHIISIRETLGKLQRF